MAHKLNCICSELRTIELKTKVSLIIYKKEQFLPSSTAQLVTKTLLNSSDFTRGIKDVPLTSDFLSADYNNLFLYPSSDAEQLNEAFLQRFDHRPFNLIVPDGTWRQASKVHKREELLKEIPRVKINSSDKTIYPLRRQKYEYGLCTFEAVAAALEVLESEDVKEFMMKNFKLFIDAHLKNRVIYDKEVLI